MGTTPDPYNYSVQWPAMPFASSAWPDVTVSYTQTPPVLPELTGIRKLVADLASRLTKWAYR